MLKNRFTKEEIITNYKNLTWNFDWIKEPATQFIITRLKDLDWRFVGGIVRDSLINRKTKDIDINTPHLPGVIKELFKDCNISDIGEDHGTIMIFFAGYKFEITTLRIDKETDGRHAKVDFCSSWEEDSKRRDFTINALMLDYRTMIVYDYQKGLKDLNNKIVNFIRDYKERIEEDYLRILRFVRFAVRFQSPNLEENLIKIKPLINGLKNIANERIMQEIVIMLENEHWKKAAKSMSALGVDTEILGIRFNSKEININLSSVMERMGYLFLNNPSTQFSKLCLPSNIRKSIIKANIDLDSVLENNNKIKLFNVFSYEVDVLRLMEIKTLLDNKIYLLDFIKKILFLQKDQEFLSKLKIGKQKAIEESTKPEDISKNINKVFEKLFFDDKKDL